MQTLSVTEHGISYLWKCFLTYNEGCLYFLLYVAALLCILMGKETRLKKIFLPGAFCMLVTVFNPVFPVVLNRIFDVNKEYYRFFWIAPVVIAVSVVAAMYVSALRPVYQVIAGAFVIFTLAFSGKYLYSDGMIKALNVYKMPSEILQISEMIHRDSKVEYPRAVFEFDYEMCIRQYDPKIMLAADREQYINAVNGSLTMEEVIAKENYYNRLLAVIVMGVRLSEHDFKVGLDETNTEYMVVTKGSAAEQYLNEYHLDRVGETLNHVVFHYDLEDPKEWTLPDYSDVWENY